MSWSTAARALLLVTRFAVPLLALPAVLAAQEPGAGPCRGVAERKRELDQSADQVRRDLAWIGDRLTRLAASRRASALLASSELSEGAEARRRLADLHARAEFLRSTRSLLLHRLDGLEADTARLEAHASEHSCPIAPQAGGGSASADGVPETSSS
jgi:hypothetical protein